MNKFKFLPFIAAAAVITGCQEYDFGLTVDEIRYKESFTNAFGQIDPNQNWDLYGQLAGGAKSGMTRAGASDITVTDLGEDRYALITKAESEAYQKMLPESDTQARPYAQTNLGRVTQDFVTKAKTITLYPVQWATTGNDKIGIYYYDDSDPNAEAVTDINGETKHIVKKEVYINKTHVYTLNVINAYCYTDQNKYFCGTWEYPITMFDILSEAYPTKYYLDGTDKKVTANDGTVKSALEFYSQNQAEWKQDLIDCGKGFTTDGTSEYKDPWNNTIASGSFVFLYGQTMSTPQAFTDSPLNSKAFSNFNRIQSRPIEISIPTSVDFVGFYIDNNGLVSYSESALNAKVTFSDEGTKNACFVATYVDENTQDEEGNNVRYLCFEDWMAGSTNFDLNDIVFRVYGMNEETIVDNENYTEDALLVCEDLGDFDFDFNDVVLKLTYINGIERTYHKTDGVVTSVEVTNSESIKVTPMAAGGANESTVTIHPAGDTGESNDFVWGEIHTLLDGSAPSIINAGPNFGGEGQSINCDAQIYGATWNKTEYPTYLSMLFDKGFIKITSSGETAHAITSNNTYTTTGNAPQMMLLPMSFEWPQERNPISEVYTGFSSWVSDITATDWINSNNGKVTKR